VIGISGATRCGKGTLTKNLRNIFHGIHPFSIISEDYYVDYENLVKTGADLELPENTDFTQMITDIDDRITCFKKMSTDKSILVVEGFLLFHDPRIIQLMDVKIWLEISEETMYQRRMKTKKVEDAYFQEKIIPGYRKYKKDCDMMKGLIHINGEVEEKKVLEQVMTAVPLLRECSTIITPVDNSFKRKIVMFWVGLKSEGNLVFLKKLIDIEDVILLKSFDSYLNDKDAVKDLWCALGKMIINWRIVILLEYSGAIQFFGLPQLKRIPKSVREFDVILNQINNTNLEDKRKFVTFNEDECRECRMVFSHEELVKVLSIS
jgi:uridine kinase